MEVTLAEVEATVVAEAEATRAEVEVDMAEVDTTAAEVAVATAVAAVTATKVRPVRGSSATILISSCRRLQRWILKGLPSDILDPTLVHCQSSFLLSQSRSLLLILTHSSTYARYQFVSSHMSSSQFLGLYKVVSVYGLYF